MNLVLFEPGELAVPLPPADRRVRHILGVLRRKPGDSFDAGVVNGPRGKATVISITERGVAFAFAGAIPPESPAPLMLAIGLPRPQTARDILRDATTLGVSAIHFIRAEKAEPGYAQSSLWSSGEWRRHVLAGAEQAFVTRVPIITHDLTLREFLAGPGGSSAGPQPGICLDNYEPAPPLADMSLPAGERLVLALGPERGWSAGERQQLAAHAYVFAHLGSRVLRTETAVVAALTLVRAKLGLR